MGHEPQPGHRGSADRVGAPERILERSSRRGARGRRAPPSPTAEPRPPTPAAAPERAPAASSLFDVLDRVLDKGVVIDPWARVSPAGIDLLAVGTHLSVASVELHADPPGIDRPRPRARRARAAEE